MSSQPDSPPVADPNVVYDELWQELVGIFARHQLLKQLFGTKEDLEVINRSAGVLFSIVQRDMVDFIFASAMRVLDKDNRSQANLSFWRLVEDAHANHDPADAALFDSNVSKLYDDTSKVRRIRNKKLSHLDLDIPMKRAPPLEDVTWKELDDLISRLHEVFDQWSLMRHNRTHGREVGYADAHRLIRDLKLGQEEGERQSQATMAAFNNCGTP